MMKQRINKKWFFQFLSPILFFCLNISAADNANVDVAQQLQHKEQIERQEQQLSANLLVKTANQNFLDKQYEVAKNQCLKAITVLSKISPPNKTTETKIFKIKDLLAMIYSYWAEDVLRQADSSADSGKLKDAILLCRQATEINPKLKDRSDRQIEELEQKIKQKKYKDITSESSFNLDYKKKLYNIDVLYEQGKKLYNHKDYTKAKNKLEELLVLDPYNSNAIHYLQLINNEIYYAGQDRYDVTVNKRIAETEWRTLNPIIAKTLSGSRIDIAESLPIPKDQNVDIIKKKLDSIIIKHIAFEEVPIKTAMMFLKRESKKLDPEGKGINIFLRINEKKASKEITETDKTEGDETLEEAENADLTEAEENSPEEYLITIVLDNVPLGRAIEYVCAAAGLKYNIGSYAVEIFSYDIPSSMETVVFPIDKGQYISEKAKNDGSTIYTVHVKTFFTERGVSFPEGASAVYDSKISRLIVRNTPAEILKISKIITELNTNTPQVSISAKFVEIEQKDFEELGFEWRALKVGAGKATSMENSDQINKFALVDQSTTPKYDRAFGVNYTGQGGFTLNAVVHALDQNEKINLLSAPKVTTLSGQKAIIKMTTTSYYPIEWQEPTLTTQTGENGTSYYIPPAPTFDKSTEEGIIFFVTPFVESDHYTIDVELEPQIQKFTGWTDYTYNITGLGADKKANIKMPKFKLQAIKTNLKIYDGETVVLGGVTKDKTNNTDDRIPILGELPLFGRFFRSEIEDSDKTNLLIFTKVVLVKPDGSPLRPKMDNGLPNFEY